MRLKSLSALIFATTAIVAGGAALGQQGPESLLPPGFGDPPPPPPAAKGPSTQPAPTPSAGAPSATPSPTASKTDEGDEEGDEEEITEIRYDVPPTSRRSLKQVGIMSEGGGGFPATAYGGIKGTFLMNVARKTKAPLASRWGTIMTRRLLASRTNTPADINGADWVAERAGLILRMGDAVVARQLVQQVDSGAYSNRLLEVSMPVFLANADLSGMCPVADAGAQRTEMPEWKTALSVCAALAGEQARATSLLGQVRNKGWMKGIDYRLTEKAVGAGNNARTVKIEWDQVSGMNNWRHAMAQATGVEPPEALYTNFGRQADGWRAQLPMISLKTRVATATGAAALGVLSNRAMVDIYGLVADDSDSADDLAGKADNVRAAFVGDGDGTKIAAMAALWNSAANPRDLHGMLVLTARPAALIAPTDANSSEADRLIASMLTGGFDTQAARWTNVVDEGSMGWALLATGTPDWANMVSAGAVGDFSGNDDSEAYHKTALLIAGLGGLGRMSADAVQSAQSEIEANVTRESKWSQAIRAAADRGETGTVALLAAAGLQGSDWTKIPPHHLYHMVAALRTVGLEAEARMIAAEAVSFG